MRLGLYPIAARPRARRGVASYGAAQIEERHRHRYEVDERLPGSSSRRTGSAISGVWAEKQLVEIIELPDHPWFVAGQFHPEFRSRPWAPHPLFAGFVGAALRHGSR